jgi:hypothetical protein
MQELPTQTKRITQHMCKLISDHNHMFDMQDMYRMFVFKIHAMTLLKKATVQNSHRYTL